MPETIYASFADATLCEQAAGALIDYGVRKEDVSLVSHDSYQPGTQQVTSAAPATTAASPGDTMGAAALAGKNTLGNNVAYPEGEVPPAQADLVGSGHAASNYSDAHAALSNTAYNSEYRDQRSAPMPDTSATNVGRFGDDNTLDNARSASPAISSAHDEPVIGYGATRVPGTGEHSSATDHDSLSTITHLTDSPTTSNHEGLSGISASPIGTPITVSSNYATNDTNPDVEGAAKQGISVTTAADAEAGAAKGAVWGLGLGRPCGHCGACRARRRLDCRRRRAGDGDRRNDRHYCSGRDCRRGHRVPERPGRAARGRRALRNGSREGRRDFGRARAVRQCRSDYYPAHSPKVWRCERQRVLTTIS